ncbi:GNAT family N-acetyltransferase [Telluria aromaticivorans]|uniref:GNAT family N-acetyltransferase n=1 Tax=Telluria aromaticivorans TaxID=2725995 RepID=A0A7Y2JW23_9BURK|nr:GNAT family N-acetyltransferase [Telluria aromaticivorans]NNG22095.1 GNAT family N-acetyltransferase [Telluria aromaticivorans]
MTVLHTARLRLEPTCPDHYAGLRVLNADPAVVRFIGGKPDSPEETRAMIERVQGRWQTFGYSWWSFIEQDSGELVGAGCIQHLGHIPANAHEIGWRLRPDRWGRGYAAEAARRMAAFAFDELRAPLLVAICDPGNVDSARVMERLGMRYQGEETWDAQAVSRYEVSHAGFIGSLAGSI